MSYAIGRYPNLLDCLYFWNSSIVICYKWVFVYVHSSVWSASRIQIKYNQTGCCLTIFSKKQLWFMKLIDENKKNKTTLIFYFAFIFMLKPMQHAFILGDRHHLMSLKINIYFKLSLCVLAISCSTICPTLFGKNQCSA